MVLSTRIISEIFVARRFFDLYTIKSREFRLVKKAGPKLPFGRLELQGYLSDWKTHIKPEE
jgi:hypothetical protein